MEDSKAIAEDIQNQVGDFYSAGRIKREIKPADMLHLSIYYGIQMFLQYW